MLLHQNSYKSPWTKTDLDIVVLNFVTASASFVTIDLSFATADASFVTVHLCSVIDAKYVIADLEQLYV